MEESGNLPDGEVNRAESRDESSSSVPKNPGSSSSSTSALRGLELPADLTHRRTNRSQSLPGLQDNIIQELSELDFVIQESQENEDGKPASKPSLFVRTFGETSRQPAASAKKPTTDDRVTRSISDPKSEKRKRGGKVSREDSDPKTRSKDKTKTAATPRARRKGKAKSKRPSLSQYSMEDDWQAAMWDSGDPRRLSDMMLQGVGQRQQGGERRKRKVSTTSSQRRMSDMGVRLGSLLDDTWQPGKLLPSNSMDNMEANERLRRGNSLDRNMGGRRLGRSSSLGAKEMPNADQEVTWSPERDLMGSPGEMPMLPVISLFNFGFGKQKEPEQIALSSIRPKLRSTISRDRLTNSPSFRKNSLDDLLLDDPATPLSRSPRTSQGQSRTPRNSQGRLPRDSQGRTPRDSQGQSRSPRMSQGRTPGVSQGRTPRVSQGRTPRVSSGRTPGESSGDREPEIWSNEGTPVSVFREVSIKKTVSFKSNPPPSFKKPRGLTRSHSVVHQNKAHRRLFLSEDDQMGGLMNPHTPLRSWIDVVVMTLVVYSLFSIPFFAAFLGLDSGPWIQIVIELLIDVFFLIDVCLEFYTAQFSTVEEGYIVGQGEIVELYMRGWFFVDFTSSLPLELVLLPSLRGRHIIRLVKMLRVFRLRNFGRGGQVIHTRVVGHILRLVKVLVRFLYITHIIGCSMYATSRHLHDFDDRTWATQYGLDEDELINQFLKSLFYSLSVTTGIGNTPAPPTLQTEVAMMCIAMVVGTAYLSYAIANMFDLISSIKRNEAVYDYNLDQLKYWLEHKKIPKATQEMAMRHFNYQWERSRFVDDDTVLSHLSPSLQLVLRRFLCRDVVTNVGVFSTSSDAFVDQLVNSLRAKFITSGEIVCRQDEMGIEMYIVSKGEIAVMLNHAEPTASAEGEGEGEGDPGEGVKERSAPSDPTLVSRIDTISYITVLGKGSIFGEISIIFDVPRICTCRTITQSDLFTLSKEEFFSVIGTWPEEYDLIRDIANDRSIMTTGTDLNVVIEEVNNEQEELEYRMSHGGASYGGLSATDAEMSDSDTHAARMSRLQRNSSIIAPNLKSARTAYNYRRRQSMEPRQLQAMSADKHPTQQMYSPIRFRKSESMKGKLMSMNEPDSRTHRQSSPSYFKSLSPERKTPRQSTPSLLNRHSSGHSQVDKDTSGFDVFQLNFENSTRTSFNQTESVTPREQQLSVVVEESESKLLSDSFQKNDPLSPESVTSFLLNNELIPGRRVSTRTSLTPAKVLGSILDENEDGIEIPRVTEDEIVAPSMHYENSEPLFVKRQPSAPLKTFLDEDNLGDAFSESGQALSMTKPPTGPRFFSKRRSFDTGNAKDVLSTPEFGIDYDNNNSNSPDYTQLELGTPPEVSSVSLASREPDQEARNDPVPKPVGDRVVSTHNEFMSSVSRGPSLEVNGSLLANIDDQIRQHTSPNLLAKFPALEIPSPLNPSTLGESTDPRSDPTHELPSTDEQESAQLLSSDIQRRLDSIHFSSLEQFEQVQDLLYMFAAEVVTGLTKEEANEPV